MMRKCFLLLLLISTLAAFGQEQNKALAPGTVQGEVQDGMDSVSLQSATITLYKQADSTILDFRISDNAGLFNFTGVPANQPMYLTVTYSGYEQKYVNIMLDTLHPALQLPPIHLVRSRDLLDDVVVQTVLPIRMNGDTLEINPGAFKLDSNAVGEDLLRRVPGVVIWGDGKITVNGRDVDKLYVDGKSFFGGSPDVATQNIPKNAIDRIQVYTEKDYEKDDIVSSYTDSTLTMNIKLKEGNKKGYFGKIGGGYGTDKRYEADGSLQLFNNKDHINFAAAINNTNKQVSDAQAILRGSNFRSFNPNLRYAANFGGTGESRTLFASGNYSHNFRENNNSWFDNRISANYSLSGNKNFTDRSTISTTTLENEQLITNSNSQTNSTNYTNNIGTTYNNRNRDRDFSIGVNASIGTNNSESASTSSVDRSSVGQASINKRNSTSEGDSKQISFNTRYRNNNQEDEHNLKDFSLRYSLSYNENNNKSHTITDFTSFVNAAENKYFDRLSDNNSNAFNQSLNLGYNGLKGLLFGSNNFYGINIALQNNLSFNQNKQSASVKELDTLSGAYLLNAYLTNDNRRTVVNDRPSLGLTKQFAKQLSGRFRREWMLRAHLGGQLLYEKNESSIDYRNVNRNFGFFTPSASAEYNYQRFNVYTLTMNANYERGADYAGIDQLFPIIDSSNVYNKNYGNPNLSTSSTDNYSFRINFNQTNSQKKAVLSAALNMGYGATRNAFSDSTFIDSSAQRSIYLINVDGQRNFSMGGNLNMAIKMDRNMLQLRYSGSLNTNRHPGYITTQNNEDELNTYFTISQNRNWSNQLSAFFSLGDILVTNLSQSFSQYSNIQQQLNNNSAKSNTSTTSASFTLNYPKKLSFSSTLDYNRNKNGSVNEVVNYTIWNAFVTYRFMKGENAEIKFSAMDILRQNQNISNSVSGNNVSTTVTNGLQQFFMLTLSYYPRKFSMGQRGVGRGMGRSGGSRSFNRGGRM